MAASQFRLSHPLAGFPASEEEITMHVPKRNGVPHGFCGRRKTAEFLS
jgi:hypothetical protein